MADGDEAVQQTSNWLTESMGRMENVSDEALQRGMAAVQQGYARARRRLHRYQALADEDGDTFQASP
ncbi:hypothetical protein KCP74_18300 [Salmonella enterica subsp. enterica]|nr:hypothetical protein KCP74_18300 [Salmonella enterica subsp. enterica]